MFSNLASVLLGSEHPLMIAYRQMWALMQSQLKADLHTALEYRAYVKSAHLLRSIQMVFYAWFTHRRARLTPPNPDFATTLQHIIMQTYILPTLPPKLYYMVYPKKTQTSQNSLPGSVSTSVSASSASTSTFSGGASVTSAVSGLTSISEQGATPTARRGARIANLSPIPSIVDLVPSATKLKDLIGTTNPPTLDTGREMCLSFLLKMAAGPTVSAPHNIQPILRATNSNALRNTYTSASQLRLDNRHRPLVCANSTTGSTSYHRCTGPTTVTARQRS
jgi:hypothetical protein